MLDHCFSKEERIKIRCTVSSMYSDIANESFHYTAQIKGSLQQVKEDTFAAKTKQLQLHSDSVNIKLWVVKTKLNVSFTQTFMQACFCTSKSFYPSPHAAECLTSNSRFCSFPKDTEACSLEKLMDKESTNFPMSRWPALRSQPH